jgi:hypothetical protein
MKQFEEEERIKEEVNREFYGTKAGKIWRDHPMWSKDDCERLAGGEIWIGMEFEMVKFLNGKPNSANPSNYGTGVQWQWCWYNNKPSCFYDHNNDGKIDAYN